MKLELKHLAPYLPYGLKFIHKDRSYTLDGLFDDSSYHFKETNRIDYFHSALDSKPILRPLTDFEKFECIVDEMNEMQMGWLKSHIELGIFPNPLGCMSLVSASAFLKMIECHIDVFGLIKKGLAIDINTLSH